MKIRSDKLLVFITLDIEITGLKQYVDYLKKKEKFQIPLKTLECEVNGKNYGLNFITSSLLKHSLKGTFFVEPFCQFYFGEEYISNLLAFLKEKKQDIQLHIHPAWLSFLKNNFSDLESDVLSKYPLEKQTELICLGKTILKKYGVDPIAFRSPGFSANLDTYTAMKENGFKISSNYNFAEKHNREKLSSLPKINDITLLDNKIYEIPISNYLIYDIRNLFHDTYKPMQVCCTSFPKLKKVLESAYSNKMKAVTILLHNFEFLDRSNPDWLEKALKVNLKMIKYFEKLCQYLEEKQEEYQVLSFSDFSEMIAKNKEWCSDQQKPFFIHRFYRLHWPI